MIKIVKKLGITLLAISLFVVLSTETLAVQTIDNKPITITLQEGPPTEFAADATPEEIVAAIEAYYRSLSVTRAEEKWGESEIVYDGEVGYYITTRFWVSGANIAPYGIVGNAETKAVKAKYGSVSSSYEYKLKTTQHVVETEHQTQGQITISAQATCYGRR